MALFDFTLDDLFQRSTIHRQKNRIGSSLFGFSNSSIISNVSLNKHLQGFVFFTRPQLNLSSENISNSRIMYSLLSEDRYSVQRFIRATLDPRLSKSGPGKISSPLCNPKQAFIPLLTNTVSTVSGWPSVEIPTYSAEEGLYGDTHTIVDGSYRNAANVDFSITFKNMNSGPVLNMMWVWTIYSSLIFEGILQPYADYILDETIDYNSRIWRIVLDKTGKFVAKIGSSGPGIWTSVPMGSGFDFNRDSPFSPQEDEHTFNFLAYGAEYQDPILFYEFNRTVEQFNSSMEVTNRNKAMTKVNRYDAQTKFQFVCYPRISYNTGELEWYVENEVFDRIENKLDINSLNTTETII